MNIAFNDISEECAVKLVHLVHSYHPSSSAAAVPVEEKPVAPWDRYKAEQQTAPATKDFSAKSLGYPSAPGALWEDVHTCPDSFLDKVILPYAEEKKSRRGGNVPQHYPCTLVSLKSGVKHHFKSMRDALRFLGMNPTGMMRRFAEQMVIGEWKFSFED